jgi:hypothetical protein
MKTLTFSHSHGYNVGDKIRMFNMPSSLKYFVHSIITATSCELLEYRRPSRGYARQLAPCQINLDLNSRSNLETRHGIGLYLFRLVL